MGLGLLVRPLSPGVKSSVVLSAGPIGLQWPCEVPVILSSLRPPVCLRFPRFDLLQKFSLSFVDDVVLSSDSGWIIFPFAQKVLV